MTTPSTREQAAQAVAAAVTERDNIQANLLDLDGSFGKRLLAGAKLTGETQQRWAATDAALAALWETFNAYTAVVDKAAELSAGLGRAPAAKIAEIASLLTGPSVRIARAPAPLGQRELTTSPSLDVTLATAVAQMRGAYRDAAALCASAETVWNEVADGLQRAGTTLDTAGRQAAGLADDQLAGALAAAQANLGQLRERLNTDPLTFWRGGRTDTSAVDRLQEQVAAVAARVAELGRLRADAGQRIAAVQAALAGASAAWQDATTAQARAASRIAGLTAEQLPDPTALAGRLTTLDDLRAAGRWNRLAAELDAVQADITAATRRCRDAERAATAQLDQRDELRGLLDAYKAKAARLGAAEDPRLQALHEQASGLLWTAPCDLAAAGAAVSDYQHAVLALDAAGRRP
jgi:hypothetical protein